MAKVRTGQRTFTPKVWEVAAPKEFRRQLKEPDRERYPEQKDAVEGATNQVEMTRRQGSVLVVRSASEARKQFIQCKEKRGLLEQSAMRAKLSVRKFTLIVGNMLKRGTRVAASIPVMGGAAVCLVSCLTVFAVAAVAASPFGILFAGESTGEGSVPVSAAIAQINFRFNEFLEELQTKEAYDEVTLQGDTALWTEVLAVFATKVAGADVDATDVATMDANRIAKLEEVFWDMNEVFHEVETVEHSDSDSEDDIDDSWTERILHITITPKFAEDMLEQYRFSSYQASAMNELLAQETMLQELVGDTTWLCEDAKAVLQRLPEDLSPERRAVIETACSLVGKVNYFWGGKSLELGWDERWGQMKKVWAVGNSTTGTYRPFGLDCSGFVDWVFYNAMDGEHVLSRGGGAASQHSYCTDISWEEAQIGDLAFYEDDSHVGIVAGWDENGEIVIVHCSASYNNIVVTGQKGFHQISRPSYYHDR